MLSLNDRVIRGEGKTGESSDEDYLLLDLDSGDYYGLGPVGGLIWERLDGQSQLAVIAQEVAETFGVAAQTAEADLLEFVGALVDAGLARTVVE
jgi:hypothetical protein